MPTGRSATKSQVAGVVRAAQTLQPRKIGQTDRNRNVGNAPHRMRSGRATPNPCMSEKPGIQTPAPKSAARPMGVGVGRSAPNPYTSENYGRQIDSASSVT